MLTKEPQLGPETAPELDMTRKSGLLRWSVGMACLAATECAVLVTAPFVFSTPAEAQFFDQRNPYANRQRQQRSGGFFQELFGGGRPRYDDRQIAPPREQAPADYSRAPAARKDAKSDHEPTTTVVVLGDSMADWLAYGLEDAFGDTPEISVVRKNKANSGLLRYDARSDLDWWHVARDLLAPEKPSYVVMMLGLSDRQNIREKDLAREAEREAEETSQTAVDPANPDQAKKEGDEDASIVAPEPKTARRPNGVIEFRTDAWEKIYSRRIDETIAALKSKGVPVFWVGLPSIRGARSTADVVYLNDLYRARAEKAGAIYVDIWDGFVDEGGKFTTFGPDYEGQVRRLRSPDGVYFTKFGARKVAHYIEREVRRYMNNRGPIALPSGPMGPVPADGQSAVRPLAGPVLPLTTAIGNTDELLGGSGAVSARADATAASVLVKGDAVTPPPGRADDFIWPPGSERPKVEAKATPVVITPPPATPAPVSVVAPAPVSAAPPPVATAPTPQQPQPAATAKPAPAAAPDNRPRPPQTVDNRPRPPQPIAGPRPQQQPPQQQRRRDDGLFGANGPFGFLR